VLADETSRQVKAGQAAPVEVLYAPTRRPSATRGMQLWQSAGRRRHLT
jgi:hypothetical protein